MGHRCLSANHSFPPPAWGCLCIIVQSHISPLLPPNDHLPPAWGHLHIIIGIHVSPLLPPHDHLPPPPRPLPITLPPPGAVFTSSSKPKCLQSHHPPIPLPQPEAIFTSSLESTCIWSCCQPIAHLHLHPEIFTASSCLHSCLCILAGAGCLHGGNYSGPKNCCNVCHFSLVELIAPWKRTPKFVKNLKMYINIPSKDLPIM